MLQAEEWSTVLHGFCCIPHARRQRADGPLSLPLSCSVFPNGSGSSTHYTEVITIDDKLTIGTPEAALASCVNLFSRLFNVPEDYARYYLDMYYQLRLQYERGDEPEPPKKTKKPRPAYETRRTMNDPEKLPEAAPETEREEKFQEVLASVNAGSAPRKAAGDHAVGNHHAAEAAAEKRRIRDRLLQMRQNGVSTPQIIKGGNGCITEEQIRLIVDAKPVPIAVYRVLDGVLETLAAAPPEN